MAKTKRPSGPQAGRHREGDDIIYPPQNGSAGVGSDNLILVSINSQGTNLTASLFDYCLELASGSTTGVGGRISTAPLTLGSGGTYVATLDAGFVPTAATSSSPNNKYIVVEDLDIGATQGYSFTAYLTTGSSGSGSGALFEAVQKRCPSCSGPVPAVLTVELDDRVKGGTSSGADQLNRPHRLTHASGCVWLSQEMQLDKDLRVRWRLEKTDARTWVLVLEQKDSVLAEYRCKSKADKECKFPIELKLDGKGSKDFKKWPKFAKVAGA